MWAEAPSPMSSTRRTPRAQLIKSSVVEYESWGRINSYFARRRDGQLFFLTKNNERQNGASCGYGLRFPRATWLPRTKGLKCPRGCYESLYVHASLCTCHWVQTNSIYRQPPCLRLVTLSGCRVHRQRFRDARNILVPAATLSFKR